MGSPLGMFSDPSEWSRVRTTGLKLYLRAGYILTKSTSGQFKSVVNAVAEPVTRTVDLEVHAQTAFCSAE